jgi:hypothetical protein
MREEGWTGSQDEQDLPDPVDPVIPSKITRFACGVSRSVGRRWEVSEREGREPAAPRSGGNDVTCPEFSRIPRDGFSVQTPGKSRCQRLLVRQVRGIFPILTIFAQGCQPAWSISPLTSLFGDRSSG